MHVLHISDYSVLRRARSQVLRRRFTVVDCDSASAWRTFIDGDFDVVVFCCSVIADDCASIATQIAAYSPSAVIAHFCDNDFVDVPGLVALGQYPLDAMNSAIESAAARRNAISHQSLATALRSTNITEMGRRSPTQ